MTVTEIIDFHTHLFPDDLAQRAITQLLEFAPEGTCHTDGTGAGLERSMRRHGIGRSVVLPVATKKTQVWKINGQQSALGRSCLIPFGALHPDTDDVDDIIGYLKLHHMPGIKFHPEYQNFYIDDPRRFTLYEALSAAGLCALFHAGKDPGPFTNDHALPGAIAAVHRNFPSLRIVAAHMGGWKVWEQVRETLCGLPLFFDTSAVYGLLDPELFMRIVRDHGTDRILFGSDSPWFDQGAAVAWIDSLPLSGGEKERIYHLNARRLLDLQAVGEPPVPS